MNKEIGAGAAAGQQQQQRRHRDHQHLLAEKLAQQAFLRRGFRAFAFRLFGVVFGLGALSLVAMRSAFRSMLRGPR